jgi:hypothetical protein
MIFQRKKLSDEEYVEWIRKQHRGFRRIRWIWLVLLLCWISCLYFIASIIQSAATFIPNNEVLFYGGFAMGTILGFMFLCFAGQAGATLKKWFEAHSGFRTERLLLKYHDQLKDKNHEPPSPRNDSLEN